LVENEKLLYCVLLSKQRPPYKGGLKLFIGGIMHTQIYFITPASGLDDAISRVEGYLETENFYDYYNVLKNGCGTLESKRSELLEWEKKYDWKKTADGFFAIAEELKGKGNLVTAGYYYRLAGSLYEGLLTSDTAIYNIDSYNYEIPESDNGLVNDEKWFTVPVDFHV
jgi:hypothetical protein